MVDLELLTLQAQDGVLVEDDHVIVRLVGLIPVLIGALARVAHHDAAVAQVLQSVRQELAEM